MARYETELGNRDFTVSKRIVHGANLHFHSFYEIEFFTEGIGSQILNGIGSDIKQGVLVFMSPKDFHSIKIKERPLNIFNISFSTHMFSSDMLNLINESQPPFLIYLEDCEFDKMFLAFEDVLAESEIKDSFHERAVKYKIGNICIDIIRKAASQRLDKNDSAYIKNNDSFTEISDKIIPYLNDNYTKKISRDDAAKMVHLTPSYFSEIFKKNFGVSFSDYLIELRMSHAMRLLKYSDESIGEIMNLLGYNSSSAFYEQFKKAFGILPGEVKRQYKQE